MSTERIHIVGPGGSGKTFAANELGRRYDLPVCHLDDLFWKKPAGSPNNEPVDEADRVARLETFTAQDGWIVEGLYTAWVEVALDRATAIYFLDAPRWLRQWRTIRRGIVNRDDLSSLIALVRYNQRWGRDKRAKAMRRLAPHRAKLEMLRSEQLLRR